MAGEGVGEIKEDKKGAALVKRPVPFRMLFGKTGA